MKRIIFVNEATLSAAQLNEMQDNTQDAINKINSVIGTDGNSSSSIVARISNLENNLTETEPGSESLEGPTFADRVNNLEIAVGISEGETSLASKVSNLEKELQIGSNRIDGIATHVFTNIGNISTISQTLYGSDSPTDAGNSEGSLCTTVASLSTKVDKLEKQFVIAQYNNKDESKNANAFILYDTTDLGTKTLKPGQIYLKVTNILAD